MGGPDRRGPHGRPFPDALAPAHAVRELRLLLAETISVTLRRPLIGGARRTCVLTFGAVLLGCLCPSIAAAYRTTASAVDALSGEERVAWPSGQLEYLIHDETPPGVNLSLASDASFKALSRWNNVDCSSFRFVYGGVTPAPARPGDGQNTIQWVRHGWTDLGFDSEAAAISDVYFAETESGWVIDEADLYLNAEHFSWSGYGSDAHKSVYSVLLHEGGHLLGLAHPCEVSGGPACTDAHESTVMYPFYSQSLTQLSGDDQAGVCFLYPAGPCAEAGCGEAELCTANGCEPACGAKVCSPGQSCNDGVCEAVSPYPDVCTSDEECPPTLRCQDGACTEGVREAGDPCDSARDCSSGICADSGQCSATCVTDAECGPGTTCRGGRCADTGSALGEACAAANDCTGGICLAGVADAPLCSRSCAPPAAACADGWLCDSVEGQTVCVPPEAATKSSCAFSPTDSDDNNKPLPTVAISLLLAAALRRRTTHA